MNTLHPARAILSAVVTGVAVAAIMPAESSGLRAPAVVGGITAFATDDAWTGFTDGRLMSRDPQRPIGMQLAQNTTIR